ncbi:ketosteroid isomerase-like protein [Povalibacter uvarum]|uniref:Ketosteroid isomerase-like protein n=1 Tax=Povalibacter uvarum TaxID=732238 RepID=A0A841HSU4_9GAMM|nr:SnoaL-like domain-containing protein [Povalibacter uvarum]MBB6095379.1 ketosteroid isomerase-like protein [Povalibacter uvarum]
MSTETVAHRLVELCRQGKFDVAQNELFADSARSIEMEGVPNAEAVGMDAIRQKGRDFDATLTQVHTVTVSEPVVADGFFSIVMGLDATYKEGGRRSMTEICVYEVANDKIVREQFFYRPN